MFGPEKSVPCRNGAYKSRPNDCNWLMPCVFEEAGAAYVTRTHDPIITNMTNAFCEAQKTEAFREAKLKLNAKTH